jgi:hypothetical protein
LIYWLELIYRSEACPSRIDENDEYKRFTIEMSILLKVALADNKSVTAGDD